MRDKFLKTLSEYDMLSPGDTVAVGVSGGADSMCLLSLLHSEASALGIGIIACHVNHGIRGEEADRDEEFVRSYCLEHSIPFRSVKINVPELARKSGESTELCARNERYRYFGSLGCSKIATAHTGSDRVETMLMNLSRGSSLKGLVSIPPVRGNIIRPLIAFTRAETELYCKEEGIRFVTDSSNLSDDYTRNRYRHNVIPGLTGINPAFGANALRCIDSLERDSDYLETRAAELYERVYDGGMLMVAPLAEEHISLITRVIRRYLAEAAPESDPEYRHIDYIASALGTSFALTLPSGVIVEDKDGKLFIREKNGSVSVPEPVCFDKNEPLSVVFGQTLISSHVSDKKSSDKSAICVDFSEIDDIIIIRSRSEKDAVRLPYRNCSKTLKKLFNELKIPPKKRDLVPVFCDSKGIVAVGGICADRSRIPHKECEKYLIIKTEDVNNE